MNEQDLAIRKALAEDHRRIQRFEGDIITNEIEKERYRRDNIISRLLSRNHDLQYTINVQAGTIRKLERVSRRRSVLEALFGVNRGK